MIRLLRQLFSDPLPPAHEQGGVLSIYRHPNSTVVVPLARFRAKDGAFLSMHPMLPKSWTILPADNEADDLARAVCCAFERIETFREGAAYRAFIEQSSALWRDGEPLRTAMKISKSTRFWPEMSLVHVTSRNGNLSLGATRTLRGGAFEGLTPPYEQTLDAPFTDAALSRALFSAFEACA